MTQPRATKRRTTLEKHRDDVLAFIVDGKTDREIAAHFNVNRSSVWRFYDRHQEEIDALSLEVLRQVTDYAIADKVKRIAAKDFRWGLLEQVRQARSKGETGEATGLVVRQYKGLGSGDNFQVVEEWKLDDGLLSAMENLETSAADELGQRPRPDKGGDTYNIAKAVLVRYVEGAG